MLSLDFTNMMSAAVAGGIGDDAWAAAADRFRAAHAAVTTAVRSGALGFATLPDETALIRQATSYAERTHDRWDDVVVLGIGGSALGPIALRTALRPPQWNTLTAEQRGGFPRLHVLDNVDPVSVASALERVDPRRAVYIVTSKSGGTAETMAQFLAVRERLIARLGDDWRDHVVFVTDPAKGALRPLAEKEGVTALDIPANVGGRFSVLTPVGTLPAALIGIDVGELLGGAGEMVRRCTSDDVRQNPAGAYASLQFVADTQLGKPMHVFMPYADPLRDFAAWFVQLWAESLGKVRADGRSVGPTPIAALGATDQHSQVQLFMEGPADKTVTFVGVRDRGVNVEIPSAYADVGELAYLGGHTLGELIDVEQRATAGALATRGRPNMTVTLDRVDAHHVGQLIMFLELATAYAGHLYDVDAFNQPGVELGKRFAYALLGRADADPKAREEWDALPKSDPRFVIG